MAALNPHAGEGGLFGRQDIDVVEPTIRGLRERGFDVVVPLVRASTVFVKLHAKQFDALWLVMYHYLKVIFRSSYSASRSTRTPDAGRR